MSRRCIRNSGLFYKPIACPKALAPAGRSFGLCPWAHSSKTCSRRRCSRCGCGKCKLTKVSTPSAHHFLEHSMKLQKSQQREQPLKLHIFGISCLRARDLSLKNIPARLQRLRDRKSGGASLVYIAASATFRRLSASLSSESYAKKKNFCNAKFLFLLFLTLPTISSIN
jgi:hypothetical protein